MGVWLLLCLRYFTSFPLLPPPLPQYDPEDFADEPFPVAEEWKGWTPVMCLSVDTGSVLDEDGTLNGSELELPK